MLDWLGLHDSSAFDPNAIATDHNTALSGMPAERAGVAGAIASTGRQFGAPLGVAIVGSIVARSTSGGFTTASHAAWAVIAAFGVIVLALGLGSTGRWALGTAERNGERLTHQTEEETSDDRKARPVH